MKINIYFTMVQDSNTQNVLYYILVGTAQFFFIWISSKVKEEAITASYFLSRSAEEQNITGTHTPSTITHSDLQVV